MSKMLIKVHNQAIKIANKESLTEIQMYQQEMDTLKIDINILERELYTEENTYKLVAQDKKEKKLIAGVNIATAGRHEANVESAITKRDQSIKEAESKCEKKVKKAKAQIATLEEHIDDLEEELIEDIKSIKKTAESTLAYFQPLVDRCYEEIPVVINYPPTHFKKQDTLRQMKRRLEDGDLIILKMKAANFNSEPVVDPEDEERQRRRAQARAESIQQNKEAEARQYEIECHANLAKKAQYAADEQRARARQAERDEELKLAIDSSDPDAPLPPVESLPKRIFRPKKVCQKECSKIESKLSGLVDTDGTLRDQKLNELSIL